MSPHQYKDVHIHHRRLIANPWLIAVILNLLFTWGAIGQSGMQSNGTIQGSLTSPGLEVRVQTDRPIYLPSDAITTSLTVKNLTDSAIHLSTPNWPEHDYCIDSSGWFFELCWGYVTEITIPAFDSVTWTDSWSWKHLNLSVGRHKLVGIFGDPQICNGLPIHPLYGADTVEFSVLSNPPVVYHQGWNLLSLPINISDKRVTSIFPGATSAAFIYEGGYQSSDSMITGRGYWLKFSRDSIVYLNGRPIDADTFHIGLGWNMTGSVSEPLPASGITSDPPGIGTSNFYEYSGVYHVADTIYPGRGYWIKAGQTGKLILASNPPSGALAKNAIRIIPTAEIPPPPPEIEVIIPTIPKDYAIEQAFPNPFNPTTTLKYQLPVESKVNLRVFNLLGQVIATLVDDIQGAGFETTKWNAAGITSGLYLYRFEASSIIDPSRIFTQTGKLLLMK